MKLQQVFKMFREEFQQYHPLVLEYFEEMPKETQEKLVTRWFSMHKLSTVGQVAIES